MRRPPGSTPAYWVLPVAMVLLLPGCSVILRALGVPVGSSSTLGGRSPLPRGSYAGTGECTILLLVEGEEANTQTESVSINMVTDGDGRPIRDGVSYLLEERADLTIGRYTIELTVAAATATSEAFIINHTAALTIDAGTQFVIHLFGDAAETYTPQPDGSILYAFSAPLEERDEGGFPGTRTMAFECEISLSRQ